MSASRPDWLLNADRQSPWDQLHVLVAGIGVSGFAAADALQHLGASVTVVDDRPDDELREQATLLEILGVDVRLGPASSHSMPDTTQLVVTSPGWPPYAPLFGIAEQRGIPVWGDVELAWRLRDVESAAPWLCITGTNGKTTTVQMLDAMLRADGRRSVAAGNVGVPMCEIVMDPHPFDVVAVELSSHQLHWSHSLSAQAAAVINVAPDHLSWHGDQDRYAAAKARIYENCQVACVYNVEDPATRTMVEQADVIEGCRAIGFTLGVPAIGMLGVVDDVLADRAFVAGRDRNAAQLASVGDVPTGAPHNVANALAAAALARAHGVSAGAVRRGLLSFELDAHRISTVSTIDDITYVDDSKATNPHAALASLRSFDHVVWIAGGMAKGADFDDLVRAARERLRGVVLMGVDRDQIAGALSRHAPDIPVISVADTDTGVMERVVAAATSLAQAGDTVLLAPACSSFDLFADYAARGDAFAAAVRAQAGG
jgi:UDP-N-acetylmuramoylalanine--D-glutamate ligase